jgi:hypothetical protein
MPLLDLHLHRGSRSRPLIADAVGGRGAPDAPLTKKWWSNSIMFFFKRVSMRKEVQSFLKRMGNKGVGERACTGNDLTPAEEDQELGYYQKKKMEEHRARKQEQEKREKRTMDKLLRQVEQGTQLTADAQEWMDKRVASNPDLAAKLHLREAAKKSLSTANWASQLMKGSSSKFSSSGQASVEDMLKNQTVGLVTYDDYKKRKEEISTESHEQMRVCAALQHLTLCVFVFICIIANHHCAAEELEPSASATSAEQKKRGKKRTKKCNTLSFDASNDEDGGDC